jgi:hypothetical protein
MSVVEAPRLIICARTGVDEGGGGGGGVGVAVGIGVGVGGGGIPGAANETSLEGGLSRALLS